LQRSKLQIALLTGLDTATISPNLLNDTLLISGIDTLSATPQTINPQNHPYLDFAHSIYENGQAQEKLIRKSYLPKVYFLGAGWIKGSSINTDGSLNKDLYTGLGYTRSNYLGGLGITYDLFNSRREKDKLKVQQFHTEEALHNYEQQRQTLDNAALQASVDLKTAIDKFQEIPIQLKAAKDAYAQRLTQYNAGLSNIIDLTNALAVLNRAQTDVVNTRSGVWSALVQRAYAGGNIQQLLLNLK
jgi:outer membrane protein TolC